MQTGNFCICRFSDSFSLPGRKSDVEIVLPSNLINGTTTRLIRQHVDKLETVWPQSLSVFLEKLLADHPDLAELALESRQSGLTITFHTTVTIHPIAQWNQCDVKYQTESTHNVISHYCHNSPHCSVEPM
ncbi:hypothetical protein PoB_001172000 [Plakobranchus ocellatus]|uniref:Uncharacterized protein n=1 Tax=Plakobranchus ocellatus TaxID=259542 RepID=A0AAV3YR35_9GAST|nr:hypothetical protein PoB_001172000 [Plakobranchus ocellatus]